MGAFGIACLTLSYAFEAKPSLSYGEFKPNKTGNILDAFSPRTRGISVARRLFTPLLYAYGRITGSGFIED
jgi:hypothetical protein